MATASINTTFRALRHRNYQLWFFGQGVSLIGTWMQTMAQQVLVYRLTGSATALGIVSFMGVIPLVPFALWGGSLSDRFSKRKLLLITQTCMMLLALILGLLAWTGLVQIWHVYVMALLLGAIKSVDMPARHSFVYEMVEGRDDLTSAIGLNSAIHNSARTLGPALAGMIVALMGEAPAFLLNALSFLAVIASLLMMTSLTEQHKRRPPEGRGLAHTTEGMRYVMRQETLLVLMSLVAVSSFLSRPYQTLMPVFANVTLQASAQPWVALLCGGGGAWLDCRAPEALPLGMLMSAMGLGAVTGAFVVASLPQNARRGRWLTVGNLTFPLFLLLFVGSRSFLVSLIFLLLVGFSQVFQNSLANTLLQLNAPDALRGRVMSLYFLVSHGMNSLGGLQAGLAADWLGAPLSLGLGAGVSLLYGLFVAGRYRKVRELA